MTKDDYYAGMRDELNEALRQLTLVAMMYGPGTDVREHVDLARSQITSALLCVLKREAAELRKAIRVYYRGDNDANLVDHLKQQERRR